MRVTLKDIAKECGLAVSTVSNILNDHKDSYASDKVKANVKETADRLGYKKDYLSVSLRTKKTFSVGLCVDRVQDETRSDFVRAFTRGFNNAGYEIALMDHRFEPQRLIKNINFFEQRYKDGLVLFTDFFKRISEAEEIQLHKLIQSIKVPVLAIGTEYKGLIPCIDIDRAKALNDVLDRFNSYKREEILLVYKDRFEFRSAGEKIESFGTERIEDVWTVDDFICQWEKKDLKKTVKAIFFRTDAIAIPALSYLRKQGISIPGDIEVISFDNFRFSEYTAPPLTTYSLNFDKLGSLAYEKMIAMLNKKKKLEPDFYQTIMPDFIARESHKNRNDP